MEESQEETGGSILVPVPQIPEDITMVERPQQEADDSIAVPVKEPQQEADDFLPEANSDPLNNTNDFHFALIVEEPVIIFFRSFDTA